MDDEIKSSAELEKALEEQVTGEIPDMVEPMEQLKTATTAVQDLVAIRDTVLTEGVSQEDISSVFTIVRQLNDAGIECGIGPSMEDYEIGHYTPTRSIVNQRVSLEGIGSTLLNVIKAVLEKLIAFVAACVRKYKVMTSKDRVVEAAFDSARGKANDVQEVIKLYQRMSLARYDEVTKAAFEYAESLLKGEGKLPRSEVTLAALQDKECVEKIREIHMRAETATRYLRMSVKSLKSLAMGASASATIDVTMNEELMRIRTLILAMQVESPEPDYLYKNIGTMHFQQMLSRPLPGPIAKYEYIVKAYYSVAEELRAVRKFAVNEQDEDAARFISESLNTITQAFENLDATIQFLVHVKAVQLNVFKLQLAYLNRHFSLMHNHVKDTSVHEATRKKAEDAFDQLAKKLRTYGI